MKKILIILLSAIALGTLVIANVDHVSNGVMYIGKGLYPAKIGNGLSREELRQEKTYSINTTVALIDEDINTVWFQDENGEYWTSTLEEKYALGDSYILTMSDNKTDPKYDDKIIKIER